MVSGTCLWSDFFLGPCQDHVGTMLGLTLLPDKKELLKFSSLSQHGVSSMSIEWFFSDHVRTMLGPCLA